MPSLFDSQQFKTDDLILEVSESVDRAVWNESRYAGYLEALCGGREYQKEAIRTALRYLVGTRYRNLRDLAKTNFESKPELSARYGTWEGMERHLQFPSQLAASIDLATGTGKSYVLYGIAAILLSEGIVDRVLVLCPSTTIEYELIEKFRQLAAQGQLRDLLPGDAVVSTPSIINASETIVPGSICIENYHAVLEHVGSSLVDSLLGIGERVAVLNDEAHHVANESQANEKKWKGFLTDDRFGFRYLLGVTGTPYIKNEYFADVIYRYSLRQAMEEGFVKKVEYVAEMPRTGDPDEKWQLVSNRHQATRERLRSRGILPLTIIVTKSIRSCEGVADDLRHYLVDHKLATVENVDRLVLAVHSNALDLAQLRSVDSSSSEVEWIVSVSMLNEGWDVKRVFTIVPHEERAFNSKLLISQVLGRGLRIPEGWVGPQPTVTVFNHDAWASRIRHLVNEVLEYERKITSRVVPDSPHHFVLHSARYELTADTVDTPMGRPYSYFEKGYVNLSSELPDEDVSVEFERADTGTSYDWQTRIRRRTYTPREVAVAMYQRLQDAEAYGDANSESVSSYTEQFPIERLEEIVVRSLDRINKTEATESMKQKFLSALGTLRRRSAKSVRYTPTIQEYFKISTMNRPADSASVSELRHRKTIYFTERSRASLDAEQVEVFDELSEPGSDFKAVSVSNFFDFKTPVNVTIADSEPERKFLNQLVRADNASAVKSWIKSTATRFYDISYTWRKGEHTKQGKFNPDFFLYVDEDLILIVEVKDDSEIVDPSEENVKKYLAAVAHFRAINRHLSAQGVPLTYQFHFLTPQNMNAFFQHLREGQVIGYQSELDVVLKERSGERAS